MGAGCHAGERSDVQRGLQGHRLIHLGSLPQPHPGTNFETGGWGTDHAGQDILLDAQVRLERADVFPVGPRHMALDPAPGCQQGRHQVLCPVDRAVRGDEVQH